MKRKFITNLALLVCLNLLIKPFWIFGIDRTIQNVVGAQEYGLYFSLFNFSMMLNILLDLGITNYNNRNIAQHNQLLSKYLSNVVILKFVLAILYFFVCLFVAVIIGYHWEQIKILFLLMFNQFLISFTLYLRSNISGLHFFKTDSMLSVLDKTLMIIICSALLWGNITKTEFKIEWFVYAQTVAYGLTTIVTFFVVLAKSGFLRLKFDLNFFIVFLKQSYPYALLILLMALYNRIDSVMLERLLPNGREQAGIYAQAFRILDAVSMFAFLFAGLLLPMFARMIKLRQSIVQLTQFSYSLIIVPAIILSITSFIYRQEIMNLLYKSHIEMSADLLGILMIGFLSISTTYIFGTLLTANGSMRELNIMACAGMILNIVLNFVLIPRFYALGSAVASLVTQTVTAAAQIFIARKIFNLKFNYKFIFTLFAFVIAVCGIGIFSKYVTVNWLYGFLILILISSLLAFALKLINLKSLYLLLVQKEDHPI
ncbi:MAG: oligosaccharide flippase family protein [Bacteroidia bacterium]|nr:oligosaccharide flippase family protein [Bacteroidia bacterium]